MQNKLLWNVTKLEKLQLTQIHKNYPDWHKQALIPVAQVHALTFSRIVTTNSPLTYRGFIMFISWNVLERVSGITCY